MKSGNSLSNRIILLFGSPALLGIVWFIYLTKKQLPLQQYFDYLPMPVVIFLSIFLALGILFLLNFFNNKFAISKSQNPLSIFFFSIYFISYSDSKVIIQLISYLLLILVFYQILNSADKPKKFNSFFNAGFIIGFASIFNPPFILFFFLIIFSLVIFGTHSWREWVLSFIGLFLSFFLFYSFRNIFFSNFSISYHFDIVSLNTLLPYSFDLSDLFFVVYFLLILISVFNIFRNFSKQKIRIRHIFLFYFLIILISSVGFFIFPNQKTFFFLVSVFPFSILISNDLVRMKNVFFLISFLLVSFLLPLVYYFG